MAHVHSHTHNQAHSHGHHHHHAEPITNVNTAFIVGISLNLLFVIIEAITGFYIHSLSLLSDAGHNLADVAALALSLFAYKMLKVKSNEKYTYGYRKTSVLVSLLNAAVLLVSIGAIAFEAIYHIFHPVPLAGQTISIVAGVGIVINTLTALMFFKDKEKDINVKSAYLHLISDAVVSLGLVIGGVIIMYTKWFWLDSVLSLVIAVVILISTWNLLRVSLRLSLDGVPDDISIEDIKATALAIAGVKDIHHIHVWAISTTENALTAHVLLSDEMSYSQEESLKKELRHELLHKNIQHVTLETERALNSEHCKKC
jgi:cobalt-zinc-cadmium efflux system protein